jgi:hypothetical protein
MAKGKKLRRAGCGKAEGDTDECKYSSGDCGEVGGIARAREWIFAIHPNVPH